MFGESLVAALQLLVEVPAPRRHVCRAARAYKARRAFETIKYLFMAVLPTSATRVCFGSQYCTHARCLLGLSSFAVEKKYRTRSRSSKFVPGKWVHFFFFKSF